MSDLFSALPPPPDDGPYARGRATVVPGPGVVRSDITRHKHKGHENSEAAHEQTLPNKERDKRKILDFLRQCGADGATAQEIAHATWIPYQTVSGRCAEMKYQDVTIREDGRKRATTNGSLAAVLVLVEPETTATV